MNLEILRSELIDDPLGMGYASMSDAQAADLLNVPNRPGYKPVAASDVRMFVLLHGIWPSLAALAQSSANPLYQGTAITILQTLGPGSFDTIRMNRLEIRTGVGAMLQTMVDAGAMTADQRTAMLAMSEAMISRAEELGLPVVYHPHIAEARNG